MMRVLTSRPDRLTDVDYSYVFMQALHINTNFFNIYKLIDLLKTRLYHVDNNQLDDPLPLKI